jgi:cell division inhibitor SepF
MASMWRRTMVYLGLQDDDDLDYGGEYEAYGDYDHVEEPRDQQNPRAPRARDEYDAPGAPLTPTPLPREPGTTGTVRATPTRDRPPEYNAPDPAPRPSGREDPTGMSTPRPSVVRTIGPTTAARVHVVEPQNFNDAQEVGDRLKANQPVILNLQGLPRELQRRLIDFSSGLAYAVAASMQRVADQVFLLTPTNVEVSQEEKDRLQARGLYQA